MELFDIMGEMIAEVSERSIAHAEESSSLFSYIWIIRLEDGKNEDRLPEKIQKQGLLSGKFGSTAQKIHV